MALTPVNDQALLREVDDAVRADMLLSGWQRYGRWLIVAIGAALVLFGGWLWWSDHSAKVAGSTAERMAKVTDMAITGTPDAKEVEALTQVSGQGYRTNALLVKAAMAAKAGKKAEAIALYQQMSSDGGIAQPYRDLALIKQTVLEFDTLSPDAVIVRLKPMAVVTSPWFGSAGEMTGIAFMKKKDFKSARPIFAALANDTEVSESIRSRAAQMASLLGIEAINPGAPPPSAPPAE